MSLDTYPKRYIAIHRATAIVSEVGQAYVPGIEFSVGPEYILLQVEMTDPVSNGWHAQFSDELQKWVFNTSGVFDGMATNSITDDDGGDAGNGNPPPPPPKNGG